MKTISHSGLKLWRNCKRQYFYSYELLRRPKTKPAALAIGTMWDQALEAWHQGANPVDQLLRAVRHFEGEANEFTRAKLEAMLVGYTAKWAEEPMEVVATQVGFTVPILHPDTGEAHREYQYHGVLDAIVRFQGRLSVLESKSSGEDITPGSMYWQRVTTLDPQVSMYLLAGQQAGHDVVDCLYDVARKPALKPQVKETAEEYRERIARDMQARPDWYFQRQRLVRLNHEARAYQQDLWDYACELTETAQHRRYPRNPDHCRSYGRACEYIGVCSGVASIDDPVLFRTEEREKNIHERTQQGPKRSAA